MEKRLRLNRPSSSACEDRHIYQKRPPSTYYLPTVLAAALKCVRYHPHNSIDDSSQPCKTLWRPITSRIRYTGNQVAQSFKSTSNSDFRNGSLASRPLDPSPTRAAAFQRIRSTAYHTSNRFTQANHTVLQNTATDSSLVTTPIQRTDTQPGTEHEYPIILPALCPLAPFQQSQPPSPHPNPKHRQHIHPTTRFPIFESIDTTGYHLCLSPHWP